MARYSFSSRFPTVHPFATVCVFIRDKNATAGLDKIFFLSKKVITARKNFSSESFSCQVYEFCKCRF